MTPPPIPDPPEGLSGADQRRIQAEEEYRHKLRGWLETNSNPTAPQETAPVGNPVSNERGKWAFLGVLVVVLVIFSRSGDTPNPAAIRTEAPQPVPIAVEVPGDRLTIKSQTWSKGGFGSVATVNLQIANAHDYAVKDIRLKCQFYGPSGTKLSENAHTIFDAIQGGKSKWFAEVNVGFIDSQADRGGCKIEGADRN